MSTVVTAIVYAFMTHCSCLKSACSTCSSVGKIEGMLDISNPNIKQARHTANKTTTPRWVRAAGMVRPFDELVGNRRIRDGKRERSRLAYCALRSRGRPNLIPLELD